MNMDAVEALQTVGSMRHVLFFHIPVYHIESSGILFWVLTAGQSRNRTKTILRSLHALPLGELGPGKSDTSMVSTCSHGSSLGGCFPIIRLFRLGYGYDKNQVRVRDRLPAPKGPQDARLHRRNED